MTIRLPLNSQDRFLLLEHEMLQSHGHPGIQCQAHVWWDGRVDVDVLRAAIGRIASRYPGATARLVRSPEIQHVHWRAEPGGSIPLDVVTFDDDADDAVLRFAEDILYRRIDLEREPPVWFVLVRRPTAGDVLLVPYSHVLMDGKAPEEMLLVMNGVDLPPDGDTRENEVGAWLSSYPARRRILAMTRLFANVLRGRVRREHILSLPQPDGGRSVGTGIRFHFRALDEDDTARLRERVRATIGIESLAPALVASAFRAVAGLHPPDVDGECRTYVPVTLRSTPGLKVPLFCNLSSVLTLAKRRADLADREALVRSLHGGIRDQIRSGRDMAVAQAGWWLTGRRRPVAWRIVLRNQTWNTSFIFGYHGASEPRLETILGTPVRRLYNVMSVGNPPGFSISTNLAGDRLHVALTRVDGAVPEAETEAFLDAFLEDLVT